MFKILVLFPRFMYQVLEKVLELGARSQERSQVQFLSSRKCTRFRSQTQVLVVLELGLMSQKRSQIQDLMSQIQVLVLESQEEKVLDLGPNVLEKVLDLGPMSHLGPQVLEKFLELGSTSQSQIQVLSSGKYPRFSRSQNKSQIQVQVSRFTSYVLGTVQELLCPRYWKSSQNLGSTRSVEKVLGLGPVGGPRKRFLDLGLSYSYIFVLELFQKRSLRSQSIKFLSYVLVNLLDLGHRSKKCSQIQALCPKKGSRFSSQVLETSQIQGLVPRKGPRFRSCVLDLCPRYWKRSKNQVLRPRFGPRLRSYALGLCPTYWRMSKNQVLRPGFDPRFRS